MRKTKIICTVGPSSQDMNVLTDLVKEGVDVFRLNCSHSAQQELKTIIKNIRRICLKLKKSTGILLDLEGPHLRVGEIDKDTVILKDNSDVVLTSKTVIGNENIISINYKSIIKDIKKGQTILLDDGNIKLEAKKLTRDAIYCKVIEGGILKSRKSVNIPGAYLKLPSLTSKDTENIEFGIKQNIDFLGMSFVKHPADIIKIKNILRKRRSKIWIVAKIEHPLAVDNIDDIINLSDAIMVARGDLGVELPTEEIPIIQKAIIKKCNAMAKPVIIATQMLESMIENLIPTRAEATDVANAIFDGTDAVMLSGETAVGKHPSLVVRMMEKIILKAESNIDYDRVFVSKKFDKPIGNIPHAISHATIEAAMGLKAKAIITATKSGQTARLVSSHRPSIPIYAVTTDKEAIARLNLLWGVTTFHINGVKNTDQMIKNCINVVKRYNEVESGDTVVITSGVPVGIPGKTNMLQINVVR